MNRPFSVLWPLRPIFLAPALPWPKTSHPRCRAADAAPPISPTAQAEPPLRSAKVRRTGPSRGALSVACRAAGLCGVLGVLACAGPVAVAPFSLRPDTVVSGSLLGPFDGQVVDQGTNNPIAGALVLGTWAFETPAGLATPDSSYTESTLTGNDGSYRLPKLPGGRSQPALLRRFTLVVYKAGYMGYRSDLRSDDHTPRHDFAQRQNRIRLDRFVQGESHARHLVFLGASPQLRRVAQAEIVQAALEMSERTAAKNPIAPEDLPPPAPAPEPALTLPMRLLTRGDIEEWSTQSGTANTYVLAPLPTTTSELSAGSEAVHYRAKDGAETFDAALRLWRLPSGAAAKALFTRLRAQIATPPLRDAAGIASGVPLPPSRSATPLLTEVPAAAPPLRDGDGTEHALAADSAKSAAADQKAPPGPLSVDDSLRVYDPKLRIYGVIVLSQRLGAVLQLTCGADLCKTEEGAVRLMTRVLSRL